MQTQIEERQQTGDGRRRAHFERSATSRFRARGLRPILLEFKSMCSLKIPPPNFPFDEPTLGAVCKRI
jgi:hypothetical protein